MGLESINVLFGFGIFMGFDDCKTKYCQRHPLKISVEPKLQPTYDLITIIIVQLSKS